MHPRHPLFAAVLVPLCLAIGCRIDTNKNGDNKNVKIATPFGGMQVRTNEAATLSGIGLPAYPGAELVKKDKDNGAADINMNFGNFHLRVKAASYRTPDSTDKVKAFYSTALRRFGDVIECASNRPVGAARTSEGLTCDHHDNNISTDDEGSGKLELKAGSEQHQHIVAIDTEGSGTKFGLVALDLPGHISIGDDKNETTQ